MKYSEYKEAGLLTILAAIIESGKEDAARYVYDLASSIRGPDLSTEGLELKYLFTTFLRGHLESGRGFDIGWFDWEFEKDGEYPQNEIWKALKSDWCRELTHYLSHVCDGLEALQHGLDLSPALSNLVEKLYWLAEMSKHRCLADDNTNIDKEDFFDLFHTVEMAYLKAVQE